ncbi:MAG TPA: rhodanese-like domain-containing protein [Candidatus Poseidoniales archaeon]|jgi:rhodanese-related sulfurtransferase|nr:MAG: rhodanese-like domain-containing protein [Euryarchaeota archaeon]HIF15676.1 rhodanese-like domain-containing protein [Candidatus Poseidoniales archaeon]
MWNLFGTKQDISAKKAMSKLESGWQPFILDVRSIAEVKQTGVIPGCKLSHPHSSIGKVRKQIPKNKDVFLMCKGGMRSAKAMDALIAIGYDESRLFNMKGGVTAWARCGGDFVKYTN